jgi:hypothetical protein
MQTNYFLLATVFLQVGACIEAVVKSKDWFTCAIYLCYAVANCIFAIGVDKFNGWFR